MQTTEKAKDTTNSQVKHEAGAQGISTMPPIQAMMGAASAETGSPSAPNLTGLPDTMKTNLESLSGFDMSDVRVHYNSPQPASIGALAYTQGTDIHVGPGQEKHLGHEAWHTVQQKQGRVQTNTQFKSIDGNEVGVNDQSHLEREADEMGAKISQYVGHSPETTLAGGYQDGTSNLQKESAPGQAIQRKIGFEFQTTTKHNAKLFQYQRPEKAKISETSTPSTDQMEGIWEENGERQELYFPKKIDEEITLFKGSGWKLLNDGHDLEFVTDAFEESSDGLKKAGKALKSVVTKIETWRDTKPKNQAWFRTGEMKEDNKKYDVAASLPKTMHAHPQSTMGVPLDSMALFLKEIMPTSNDLKNQNKTSGGKFGWTSSKQREKQKEKLAEVRPFIVHIQDNELFSARVRGIIALAVSSMAAFSSGDRDYPKDRLAYMYRTGFSDMVSALDTNEQDELNELIKNKKSLLWTKLKSTINWTREKDLNQGITEKNKKNGNELSELTVKTFFNRLRKGKDPIIKWVKKEYDMKDKDFPQLGGLRANQKGGNKKNLRRYGMKRPTDIGHGKREGAVIELRTLPNGVHYKKWPEFAMSIIRSYAELVKQDKNKNKDNDNDSDDDNDSKE